MLLHMGKITLKCVCKLSSGAKDLSLGLSLYLIPYFFVCEGSGEASCIPRLD